MPAGLWAGLVLALSTRPGAFFDSVAPARTEGSVRLAMEILVHVVQFAVFFVLVRWALTRRSLSAVAASCLALAAVIGLSLTNESVQAFTVTRMFDVFDIAVDVSAGTTMALATTAAQFPRRIGVDGRPITIGFVIGQLTYGGAERQLYELVRGLDRRRFRPVVYCLSEHTAPYGALLESLGVPPTVVPRRRHFEWGRIRTLAGLMRRDGVDIVHSFLFQANPYAWLAARLAGGPQLVTSARNCRTIGLVRDWANRVAFRASDAIVCNGGVVRDFIVQRYAAPTDRCVVIHNGVDLDRFAPVEPSRNGQRRPLILGVGRLVPQKDFDLFLEAAALLVRRNPDVGFAIVGDGPLRAELQRQAARLGLERAVAFLGERQDVPDLLRAADVLWLTSQWEGLPNVVLEAGASGTPVIARDAGATREIVRHEVTGYLVRDRDPESFAAYTHDLLADAGRLHGMGEAARRVVEENFSLQRMVTGTEALYRTLRDDSSQPVMRRGGAGARAPRRRLRTPVTG